SSSHRLSLSHSYTLFFFNDTSTTEIYTLSLHDALPISRYDLAALGDVTLQQPHILVVDLGGIGAGKRTGLAAAKERPAGLRWGKRHGGYSSTPAGRGSSSSPPRAGRLSRSRSRSRRGWPRSRSRKPPRSRSRKPKPRSSRSRSRSALRIIAEGPSSCSCTRTVR